MSTDPEILRDDGATPSSALVIVAHPDDIEFACGGTIARWIRGGARIGYVLVTSGDVGIDEPGMTREAATEIREAEALAAAGVMGVTDVTFLREPDGMVENTMALRRRLVREVRRFKPEVVLTFDPAALWVDEGYINHPDHRATAGAAVDAVFPASGQPLVFPELADEGFAAHKVRRFMAVAFAGQRNAVVDIGPTFGVKLAALRQHVSQLKAWDPEPTLKEWSTEAAKGTPHEMVESFRVVTLISDEEWARYAS